MGCMPSTGTPPPNGTCATAETHALAINGSVNVVATTVSAPENYPYCTSMTPSPPASPGVVYAFTLATAGVLTVTVTPSPGSALKPNVDLRSDCAQPSIGCGSNASGGGESVGGALAAGTYYVIVSGASCTSGSFSITATLTASACGNGIIDAGEDCDAGLNPPANDGCGAPGAANACKFIAAPASQDQCPGQFVPVPTGTTVLPATAGYSTYGFKDDYAGSCNPGPAPSNGGSDRVFQLTPASNGTLTVKVGYLTDGVTPACPLATQNGPFCWYPVIYARTVCADAATEITGTCKVGADAMANILPVTTSFPVVANTPYWVFVDGFDGSSIGRGPFNLVVSLQ